MPDFVRVFSHANTKLFLCRFNRVEEAKVYCGCVFGIERKVDTVSSPSCSERIRLAEPNFNR